VTVTPAGGAPVAFPAVPLPYERPDEPFNLRV